MCLAHTDGPTCVQPLVMERIPSAESGRAGGPAAWQHTKALYRLSSESRLLLQVQQALHCT